MQSWKSFLEAQLWKPHPAYVSQTCSAGALTENKAMTRQGSSGPSRQGVFPETYTQGGTGSCQCKGPGTAGASAHREGVLGQQGRESP